MTIRPVRVVLAFVAALLAWAPPASAHVSLLYSNPDDGAVLAASPGEVTFAFDDPVESVPGGVRLFDAAGQRLEAPAHASGPVLTVDVPDDLDVGTYVVGWRVVSVDGHPIAGVLTFSVGEPSARVVQPDLGALDRAWLTTALSVADAATYVGLLVGVGASLCVFWVVPLSSGPRARARLATLVTRASVVGGVGALMRVPLITADQRGLLARDLVMPGTWVTAPQDLLAGTALLLVGLGLLQAALSLRVGVRTRGVAVLLGAVLAVASPTTTGHTRSLDPPMLVALVDVWHLVAAAVWVGGLLALVVVWRSLGALARVRSLSRFSTLGAGVLVVLVPSGALLGLRIVETQEALTGTWHGRLLTAKVVCVVVAVLIALVNRRMLRRARRGQFDGAALRRTLVWEVAVLVGAVALTGALVNQSPRPAAPDPRPVGGITAVAVLDEELEALVSLSPGAVGRNDLRIVLRDPSGNAVEVSQPPEVEFIGPAGQAVGSIALVLGDDGAFTSTVPLPESGEWQMVVRQRLDEYDQPTAELLLDVID